MQRAISALKVSNRETTTLVRNSVNPVGGYPLKKIHGLAIRRFGLKNGLYTDVYCRMIYDDLG